MTGLPGWLAVYANLDDTALAALANPGLVRRAVREVGAGAVTLASTSADEVALTWAGPPPVLVRLTAKGPTQARCPCPVAGVCVHVVAACVWARSTVTGGRDEAGEAAADPLAEMLSWEPAAINRAAGIAAVRRVAATDLAGDTSVQVSGGRASISWPGSPSVVAVAGTGFAGLLVSGTHSDVAERAIRLEAVVRVFQREGRSWPWPERVAEPGTLQPGQSEALSGLVDGIEFALQAGLSHLDEAAADRLDGSAQRARLEALPLLARLTASAAGRVRNLARRDDDTAESQVLAALARAWGLAQALRAPRALDQEALVGREGGPVSLGVLVPLSAAWWTAPSGARGMTVRLWDTGSRRVETVTTGRAAGADPSFVRSWEAPLLWGVSASYLCGGPVRLDGAERRDDGTLSPTTRTRVVRERGWAGLDLADLARDVNAAAVSGSVGFGRTPEQVRLIRPRHLLGVGPMEVDEVAQEIVWEIRTASGTELLRLDAAGPAFQTATSLLAGGDKLAALAVVGDRPEAAFVERSTGLGLISLSLTPVRQSSSSFRQLQRRLERVAKTARAHRSEPRRGPIGRLCAAAVEVLEAMASTGRLAPTPRQADALRQRADQADELGLAVLAGALRPLAAGSAGVDQVLRAAVIVDRVGALAEVRRT